jgi:hypothetical protein
MVEPRSSPRPFGNAAADLDLEFASPDRPALVTALLAACAEPQDPGHWWAQTVGARLRALLALLQSTGGGEAVLLTVRCPACDERAELALPFAELVSSPDGDGPVEVEAQGRRLRLRRATGDDLRRWREAPPGSRAELLRQLASDGQPQPGDEERAAQALADAEPLLAMQVQCDCPACGVPAAHDVDLEALVLQRLALCQRAVFADVHRLASRYGWTEAQVLAVAPARRARYLSLIDAES